jgi:hypothetical protein
MSALGKRGICIGACKNGLIVNYSRGPGGGRPRVMSANKHKEAPCHYCLAHATLYASDSQEDGPSRSVPLTRVCLTGDVNRGYTAVTVDRMYL